MPAGRNIALLEIPKVTQATFQADVLQAALPVLVDFSAVWCGPCKMLDPLVQQLADEWAGKLKVFKIDADANPDVVVKYQVLSIPTLLLFSGGKLVQRLSGYHSRDRLSAWLSTQLW